MQPVTKMLIDALRADATKHECGILSELGCEFEAMEEYRSTHPDLQTDRNFGIAYTFWDSWIDQVRHGFAQNFYSGILPDDWPILAREIANCLEAETSIESAVLVKYFDQSISFWDRLKQRFRK